MAWWSFKSRPEANVTIEIPVPSSTGQVKEIEQMDDHEEDETIVFSEHFMACRDSGHRMNPWSIYDTRRAMDPSFTNESACAFMCSSRAEAVTVVEYFDRTRNAEMSRERPSES